MEAGNDAMASALPEDWASGTFLGRAATAEGPSPILLLRGEPYDMARVAPAVARAALCYSQPQTVWSPS
jgi:fumarylacetoacetate (FAA) hydrolase family protein